MEENQPIIKSANDIKIEVTKSNGEKVICEDCCTGLILMLKNTGEIGSSFLGAHNPALIKLLYKTMKKYFRTLKKQLKTAPSMDAVEVKKDEEQPSSQNILEEIQNREDFNTKKEKINPKTVDEKEVVVKSTANPKTTTKSTKTNQKSTKTSQKSTKTTKKPTKETQKSTKNSTKND